MIIKTPFTHGRGFHEMTVTSRKLGDYFMVDNISNTNDTPLALYKPAIPQLIEVLQRIHNGESV